MLMLTRFMMPYPVARRCGRAIWAEDRHVIAVEKAPAEAEEHQERHRDEQRPVCGVAHAEHGRHDQRHADGADIDARPQVLPHPAVGEPAAHDGADDRGNLPVQGGGYAGLALPDVELAP
jgi:hypothetical protein